MSLPFAGVKIHNDANVTFVSVEFGYIVWVAVIVFGIYRLAEKIYAEYIYKPVIKKSLYESICDTISNFSKYVSINIDTDGAIKILKQCVALLTPGKIDVTETKCAESEGPMEGPMVVSMVEPIEKSIKGPENADDVAVICTIPVSGAKMSEDTIGNACVPVDITAAKNQTCEKTDKSDGEGNICAEPEPKDLRQMAIGTEGMIKGIMRQVCDESSDKGSAEIAEGLLGGIFGNIKKLDPGDNDIGSLLGAVSAGMEGINGVTLPNISVETDRADENDYDDELDE